MEPGGIEALTYDVFGTVVDWRGGIARDAEALLGGKEGLSLDWNAFAIAFKERSKMAGSPEEAAARAQRSIRADDLNRGNLRETLDEFGVASDTLAPAEFDWLAKAWHRLDPWPDSVPGMTRLRTRYILAAVSSGNVALLVAMARRGGLPWDAILSAEVTGYYKPRPEAYLTAVDMLGLEPAQCLMVASHNDDLRAAAACAPRSSAARPRTPRTGSRTPGPRPAWTSRSKTWSTWQSGSGADESCCSAARFDPMGFDPIGMWKIKRLACRSTYRRTVRDMADIHTGNCGRLRLAA